jgi:hypothetical protein
MYGTNESQKSCASCGRPIEHRRIVDEGRSYCSLDCADDAAADKKSAVLSPTEMLLILIAREVSIAYEQGLNAHPHTADQGPKAPSTEETHAFVQNPPNYFFALKTRLEKDLAHFVSASIASAPGAASASAPAPAQMGLLELGAEFASRVSTARDRFEHTLEDFLRVATGMTEPRAGADAGVLGAHDASDAIARRARATRRGGR